MIGSVCMKCIRKNLSKSRCSKTCKLLDEVQTAAIDCRDTDPFEKINGIQLPFNEVSYYNTPRNNNRR